MNERRLFLLICLSLGLLAGGLRFYRLGDWAFHGDELATMDEARSLFDPTTSRPGSQISRLPRAVPLAGCLHYVSHELFGRDEFGARVLPAMLGTLHVVLVFVFLQSSLGLVPALATALLLAIWPEHLYRSQENRFYMTAAMFASLAMLCGSRAVPSRSIGWTALACLAAFAAILSHTLQGLLLLGLFIAFFAAAGRLMLRPMLIVAGAGVVAGLFFLFYVLPILRGWNGGEVWGYGPVHSVLASVSQLGWPIALLAVLGFVGVCTRGDEQGRYWAAWGLLWAAASFVLPLAVVYHPAYVFPLSLGVVVLAGQAVGMIYDGLKQQSPKTAGAWVALACLLNLPGGISHFADGSRTDLRAPAQFVGRKWKDGDTVCTFSPKLLKYYLPKDIQPTGVPLGNPIPALEKTATLNTLRIWVVVTAGRGGKPPELDRWLNKHCSLEARYSAKRMDYYENTSEVYLFTPPPLEGLAQDLNGGAVPR